METPPAANKGTGPVQMIERFLKPRRSQRTFRFLWPNVVRVSGYTSRPVLSHRIRQSPSSKASPFPRWRTRYEIPMTSPLGSWLQAGCSYGIDRHGLSCSSTDIRGIEVTLARSQNSPSPPATNRRQIPNTIRPVDSQMIATIKTSSAMK